MNVNTKRTLMVQKDVFWLTSCTIHYEVFTVVREA